MIYISGDKHGDFRYVAAFCDIRKTTRDDIMIILGDAGINYYSGKKANILKGLLSELPITLFSIHGNHENRPQNIRTYKQLHWQGGIVFAEPAYPNLLFAQDGEIFNLGGKQCMVIGGAYSVDKFYRKENGLGWWPDEQPSDSIKFYVEQNLKKVGNTVDAVFSHTCPYKYIPRESFLPSIDQSTVDNSTEKWLDTIENRIKYKTWYCGHYHVEKRIDRIQFLFDSIVEFK